MDADWKGFFGTIPNLGYSLVLSVFWLLNMNNHQQKAKGISIFLWTIRVRLTMIKPPSPVEFPIFSPYFPHSFHRFYFLVNVALPNMLFAAMGGSAIFRGRGTEWRTGPLSKIHGWARSASLLFTMRDLGVDGSLSYCGWASEIRFLPPNGWFLYSL